MFRCPLCGASARIRTSRPENDSNTVRQKYYQCNNLECGVCFSTLEAFHKFTSKHASGVHSSEGIPWHELPASQGKQSDEFAFTSELTGRIAGVTKKR